MNKILVEILELTEEILNKLNSENYDLDELVDKREDLIKQLLGQKADVEKKDQKILQKIQEKSEQVEKKIKEKMEGISDSLDYNIKGIKALKNGYLKHFESSRFKFEKRG